MTELAVDNKGDTQIVPMESKHITRVVDIHLASFQGFFLSFLGPGFLRLLYVEIVSDPDGIALVALTGGQVTGFVVGVAHQTSFYQQLARRRIVAFARESLSAVLRRPRIIPRVLRSLTHARSSREAAAQALLMSIAVDPAVFGGGIGQQLVQGFLREMAVRGIETVSLTTDRDYNERVNRFYTQLGFELARTYITPEGRAMNEYVISVTPTKYKQESYDG